MLFLNPWLLAGLAVAAVPVILHMIRRQAAKPVDWGAMRFLFDTVAMRRRTMEWEDLLLMAARCGLLALVALAVARPFVPPDSTLPWQMLLPAGMLGILLAGGAQVISSGRLRWAMRGAGLVLLLLAAGLVMLEKHLNLKRFESGGRRDVALVIDGSDSMQVRRGGKAAFEVAVEEAMELVKNAPRGTAFTVVLGGPSPEAKTAAPLTHRADVLEVLGGLRATGGIFRAQEALGVATLGLAEGVNPAKEIVVFTDSQRHGWRFENPGVWDGLGEAWEGMGSRPKLLLRDLGSPAGYRNVLLEDFSISRAVVGTDREVTIRVEVANAGDEAVTPGAVSLEISGDEIGRKPVGLLLAGQKVRVDFRHRFRESGPQVVRLRVEADDDLEQDNLLERVVPVRESLSVLLVEGNPGAGVFERAAGYTALALAPGADGGDGARLMAPEVRGMSELTAEDLAGRDVVVLADVARLPAGLARDLEVAVADGCGLLVIAGPRTEPGFYNDWNGSAGPLMPMAMGGEVGAAEGVGLAAGTFSHESLALLKEGSDLDEARVRVWRKCGEAVERGTAGGFLANGDPFMAARNYGKGRSMLVACGFDARGGNLPAKRAFVPLVHELATWLAGGGVELNVGSLWSPSVALGPGGGDLVEGEALEVVDPHGFAREATVRKGRRGEELAIEGPAVPGVYQVQAGEQGAGWLPGWEGGVLPVSVMRDAAESRFEVRSEEDLAMLRSRMDVVQAGSVADLLGVLEGKGFGREIWRLLAGAAFLLLLLEGGLARWVSKSRRAAEDVRVEFGEKAVWEGGGR